MKTLVLFNWNPFAPILVDETTNKYKTDKIMRRPSNPLIVIWLTQDWPIFFLIKTSEAFIFLFELLQPSVLAFKQFYIFNFNKGIHR